MLLFAVPEMPPLLVPCAPYTCRQFRFSLGPSRNISQGTGLLPYLLRTSAVAFWYLTRNPACNCRQSGDYSCRLTTLGVDSSAASLSLVYQLNHFHRLRAIASRFEAATQSSDLVH